MTWRFHIALYIKMTAAIYLFLNHKKICTFTHDVIRVSSKTQPYLNILNVFSAKTVFTKMAAVLHLGTRKETSLQGSKLHPLLAV